MDDRLARLSKVVSYALRHRPWEFELELSPEGWAPTVQLLSALRADPDWQDVTEDDLAAMIAASPRRRHELADGQIRAFYGHSVAVEAPEDDVVPDRLYHGTAPASVEGILRGGLSPRGRRFVHLGVDPLIARTVGRRKAAEPVILEVDVPAARLAGVRFHRASREIVVTEAVPAAHLRVLESGGSPGGGSPGGGSQT